ncbi:MAG TPA: acetyl-CoA carboxylase biotin carboxyl carrier protein subunit [Candidatus Pacearchaeota archaeon]|nr:acetyl-CoA carboxylase biotin carboxyl carrier protein subunit [Candidatus Pacearchaeota archaeon]HPR79845.1 acetyl-CoA carboxylase biotin carboxyl carrier protein subunit [Candidatus Pacearchaeota archaeon]
MDFKIKIKNKEYQIELKENCGAVKIKIGGKEFVFGSNKGSLIETSSIKKDSLNKGIASSLSGVVTKIFVKEGSHVKAGNKFLTLSAMKMENEIVAENDCKIKKILVKENQQVKEGEILIILE